MKELSTNEMNTVSGAGKLQNSLSKFYGNVFSRTTEEMNKVLKTDYDVEKSKESGVYFGEQFGLALENSFTNLLNRWSNAVIGVSYKF